MIIHPCVDQLADARKRLDDVRELNAIQHFVGLAGSEDDRTIHGAASEIALALVNCECYHGRCVVGECAEALAGSCIPHANGAVVAARDTEWRGRERIDVS